MTAWKQLTDEEKLYISLAETYHVHGLTNQQIAKILQVSEFEVIGMLAIARERVEATRDRESLAPRHGYHFDYDDSREE